MRNNKAFLVLVFFLVLSGSASAAISDGLVSYFRFDQNYYDTMNVKNASTHGSPTLSTPGVPVAISNASLFGDNNGGLNLSAYAELGTGNFTANFWLNITGAQDYDSPFMFKRGSAPFDYGVVFGQTWGGCSVGPSNFCFYDGTGTAASTSYASYFNKSTMITITKYANHTSVLYINGVATLTQDSDFGFTSVNALNLMFYQIGTERYANGKYDEFGLWNRTLTTAEISSLYNSGSGLGYPFTGARDNVSFVSQFPPDITDTNLVTYNNASYVYSFNTTGLSTAWVNLTVKSDVLTCIQSINGTCSRVNGTQVMIYNNSINTSLDVQNLTFGFNEQLAYPYITNLNFSVYNGSTIVNVTITGTSNYVSDELLNISSLTRFGFYEVQALSAGILRVYYYNSSYDFSSNPVTSTNVAEFCTIANASSYNHTHRPGEGDQLCPFILNSTGHIGTVKVNGGGFLIRGNTQGVTLGVYNVTIRTNATMTTSNSGNTWTGQAFTLRTHLHQNSLNTQVCSQGFGNYSGAISNDTQRCDTIDSSDIPPTEPTLTRPIEGESTGRIVNISWVPSMASGANVIGFYNLTLLNSSEQAIATISANTGNTTTVYWNSYAQNLTVGDTYYVRVTAYDSKNQTSFDQHAFSPLSNTLFNITINNYTGQRVTNNTVITTTGGSGTNVTNTTTGQFLFEGTKGTTYSFHVAADGYAYDNHSLTATGNYTAYTFVLYKKNTIDFSFFDEITREFLNTTTVYLELISDNQTYEYNTTNGTIFQELLYPSTYTLRYNAASYSTRLYSFTLNDNTYNQVNLTLCPSAVCSNVTVIVKDSFGGTVENATVKVLKYIISLGSYQLQEVLTTNYAGETQANIEQGTEFYKFIVEYNGITELTTSGTYIYGDTVTLVIVISAGFEDYLSQTVVNGSIQQASSIVYLCNFNDQENTATQGCLYAYRAKTTEDELYNSSCTASPSGTVYVTIENTTLSSYKLFCRVQKGGNNITVDSELVRFNAAIPSGSNIGLFMMILIMICFALIGIWNPTTAVVLVGMIPMVFIFIGFVTLSPAVGIGIFTLSIVIAFIMNR